MASTAARVFQALRSLLGKSAASPSPLTPSHQAKAVTAAAVPEHNQTSKDIPQTVASDAGPAKSAPPLEINKAGKKFEHSQNEESEPKPEPAASLNKLQTTAAPKSPVPSLKGFDPSNFKTVKPHIPMIRFRKAGAPSASIAQAAASPAASPAANAAGQKANPWKPVSAAPLEWWQTPEKYKKRPIDDLECDIINSGGRDRPFEG